VTDANSKKCEIEISQYEGAGATYNYDTGFFNGEYSFRGELKYAFKEFLGYDSTYFVGEYKNHFFEIQAKYCPCEYELQKELIGILADKFSIHLTDSKVVKDTTNVYQVKIVDKKLLNNFKRSRELEKLFTFTTADDDIIIIIISPVCMEDFHEYIEYMCNVDFSIIKRLNGYFELRVPDSKDFEYVSKFYLEHYGLKFVPIKKVNYYKEVRFR
ncbi:MAG: hypothetical protein WAS72_12685, partial [Saprospiraceae bacterium]